ncbi:IS701 family transposase [Candidatus Poribacteria bacterium]
MALIELVSSDIKQAIERFEQFHQRFAHYFATKTRTVAHRAKQYMQGQLQYQRWGNMVQFEKIVPDSDNQSLQHFASNSPWEDEPILDDVCKTVSERIGDSEHGSIHIDESGLPKQGDDSVGVARQHCGRLGKVANCQMGVFLGYTANSHRILLDKRLYLPAKWVSDKKRREKCGVPENIVFQTKAQLGLELIHRAQERDIPFAWIGMDSYYGQQEWLLTELETQDSLYIADIPCDTRAWLELPRTRIPARKGNRGRKPTKLKADSQPTRVDQMASALEQSQWTRMYIRDTERGQLWSWLVFLRVYPVRDQLPGPETWLILRKDEGEKKLKYQFCNASSDTPLESLADMSHSRYWMERAIQDAKGEAGLADYELRGWRGWHHHMTMTILAMLFLLELQLDWKPKAPNLTIQDVREILEVILPKREMTPDEILKIIQQKHKAKLSARHSKHRRYEIRHRNLM